MEAKSKYCVFKCCDMGKTTATHPQQDEASFQDDGLWKKLLTRAQQGTTNHSFFVIDVVEGCMHTSMFCKLVSCSTIPKRNECLFITYNVLKTRPIGNYTVDFIIHCTLHSTTPFLITLHNCTFHVYQ